MLNFWPHLNAISQRSFGPKFLIYPWSIDFSLLPHYRGSFTVQGLNILWWKLTLRIIWNIVGRKARLPQRFAGWNPCATFTFIFIIYHNYYRSYARPWLIRWLMLNKDRAKCSIQMHLCTLTFSPNLVQKSNPKQFTEKIKSAYY